MTPAQRLISRVTEILKTTNRFKTAQDWALAAGLTRNYLSVLKSRASTGEVKTVKQDAVQALAQAAGMTVDELIGTDGTLPSADSASSLEKAIADYRWPARVAASPERAAEILSTARAEATRFAPLPVSFWTAHLDLLCAGEAESSKLRKKAR